MVIVLAVLFMILSGLLAGTLFMVEVAIVPTFGSLPGDRWVQVHLLLDRRFDPLMPRINKVTLAICVALVVFADGLDAKLAFATGGLFVVAVAVVSELFNVRMNKRLSSWDPHALPAGWPGLRSRWAAANRIRTLFAAAGFAAAVVGGVLI